MICVLSHSQTLRDENCKMLLRPGTPGTIQIFFLSKTESLIRNFKWRFYRFLLKISMILPKFVNDHIKNNYQNYKKNLSLCKFYEHIVKTFNLKKCLYVRFMNEKENKSTIQNLHLWLFTNMIMQQFYSLEFFSSRT